MLLTINNPGSLNFVRQALRRLRGDSTDGGNVRKMRVTKRHIKYYSSGY